MHTFEKRQFYTQCLVFANVRFKFTCLLVFFLIYTAIGSEKSKTDPEKKQKSFYGKMQYAGNLGLLSVGAGRLFLNNKLSVDMSYGYLPKWVNGVRVSTFALKGAFHFWEKSFSKMRLNGFTGLSLNCGFTNNTFIILPEYYPDGYYLPNGIRIAPFVGTGLINNNPESRFFGAGFYTELGTVDYMICYALKNKSITLFEIWNLCFGMILPVKRI